MKKRKYKIYACLLVFSLMLPNNLIFANNEVIEGTDLVEESNLNDIEQGENGEDNIQKPEAPEEGPENGEGDIAGSPEDSENEEEGNIDEGMTVVPEDTFEGETLDEAIVEEIAAPIIWDGSSDTSWYINDAGKGVYEISTAQQLAGLAELVNGGYHMTDIIFKLTSDIYLNEDASPTNNEWPMIGESTGTDFRGSIDGQNHTIYNVYVNESTYSYSGFIGQATHKEPLKNIIITGSITNTNSGTSQAGVIGFVGDDVILDNITNKATINAKQAGGIVTEGSKLIIKNCKNEGTVTATEGNAGGILGYSYITTEMINCHNTGNITGRQFTGGLIGHGGSMYISNSTNNASIIGHNYDVGGLVGKTEGSKNTVQITDCTTQGYVWGWGSIGGIVGTNSGGLISNCQNLGGNIQAFYANAGGIVGFQTVNANFQVENWGSVINCKNKATVESGSDATFSSRAGGIIGSTDRMNTIQDCVNEGSVISPIKIAGGIIGQGNVSIIRCKNTGTVNVNGGNLAGGIRGTGQGIIENSENSGNVTATGDYVGGIQGDDSVASIIDSKNTGDIKGNNWVGGITGYNNQSIINCNNSGNVTGIWYAGGIVGYGAASVERCKNLRGVVTGVYYAGGIIGQSTDGTGSIKDCLNKATVSGNEFTGGIVANVKGNKTITGCVNEGEIKVNDNSNVLASRLGGIAGYTDAHVTIADCVNEGIIHSNGNWTGGIIGSNSAQLTNCINKGQMYFYGLDDRNSSETLNVGQVTGWSNGNITSCVNEGELEIILKADYYTLNNLNKGVDYNIGGISGNINNAMITDCLNSGRIYITRNNMTKTRYHNYNIGGIAGYASKASLTKSYNLGNIHIDERNGINDTYDQFFMGGIVAKASNRSSMDECINNGELRTGIRNTWIGGIAAQTMSSDVLNCIAAGDFYNDIAEFVPMAGIVYSLNNLSNGKIENSYFSGKIKIIDNDTRNLVGGITAMSFRPDWIKNAYYDGDSLGYEVITGPGFGEDDNGNKVYLDTKTVKRLHTHEMIGEAAKGNMTNFDFENMWIMHDDKIAKNNNIRYYPSLRSKPDIKNGIKFYLVTFDNKKGYEAIITDPYDQTGFVLPSDAFEFKLNMDEAYKDINFVVKDNGSEITPISEDGTYKLTNIQEDHKITVVFEKTPEVDPGEPGQPDNPSKPNEPSRPDKPSKPSRPNIPSVIYLPYIKDHLLSDVELPYGWTWLETDTTVQVGTHTYKASFHDVEGNYMDLNAIDLTIVMEEEIIVPPVEVPEISEAPSRVVDTSDIRNITITSITALLSLLTILVILCKKAIERK